MLRFFGLSVDAGFFSTFFASRSRAISSGLLTTFLSPRPRPPVDALEEGPPAAGASFVVVEAGVAIFAAPKLFASSSSSRASSSRDFGVDFLLIVPPNPSLSSPLSSLSSSESESDEEPFVLSSEKGLSSSSGPRKSRPALHQCETGHVNSRPAGRFRVPCEHAVTLRETSSRASRDSRSSTSSSLGFRCFPISDPTRINSERDSVAAARDARGSKRSSGRD